MRFFLILCLLILTTACQKAREQSHAKVSIEKLQVKTLQERLANAAKPFVVVNFFDSQCKSCEMELPSLAELQKSESKEAEVVFISMDSTAEMRKKLPAFLAKQQIEKGVYEWEGK
ncbi:MAG: TlpA family protein disulfide reductase, partial [Bacteroidia bacterium]